MIAATSSGKASQLTMSDASPICSPMRAPTATKPTTGPSLTRIVLTKPVVREDLALAVAAEVVLERLHLVVAVLLLGLGLGEPDRGDLRVAVGDARDAAVDDRDRVQAGDLLGDEDAVGEAAVRQLQAGHEVADGEHVRHVGAQALVGGHEAAVDGDAGLLVAEAGGRRAAADRDEQQLGVDGVAGLQRDVDAAVVLGDAAEPDARS